MSTEVEPRHVMSDTDEAKHKLLSLTVWVLLLCVAIECLSVELRTHRRVSLDTSRGVDNVLSIRRRADYTQVAIVGNSLVYEGLSEQVLRGEMGDHVGVETAGVPGSTYYDWEYGLRALLARGSEPDVIVFGISPSQFLRTPIVTALPVSELWRSRDIYSYYRDWHPNPTTVADLLLEHYSTFFSMRDTFRIYGRKRIYGYESMVHEWGTTGMATDAVVSSDAALETTFVQRIASLKLECGTHARLVLIIVPTRQVGDESEEPALRAAALRLGVPVIEPVGEREWPPSKFQADGYHLTTAAAGEFSVLAGEKLAQILATPVSR